MSKTTFRSLILAPHRSRVLVYLAAGLACTPGFVWAQADALQHDPFARPVLKAPPPPAQPRDNIGVAKAALPEPVWKPELDAVIVAGPKSAVSINGTIVGIGEQINGHRLVEVHEQTAVFVKDRKRVTLSLRELQAPAAVPARKDERDAAGRPDAPPKMASPETAPKQDAPPKPVDRGSPERRDERKWE
jgi:hypothetical protein